MTREEFSYLTAEEAANALLPLVRKHDQSFSLARALETGDFEQPSPTLDFPRGRSPHISRLLSLDFRAAAGWIAEIARIHPESEQVIQLIVQKRDKDVSRVIDEMLLDLERLDA